jgi:hypothetical protein
MEKYSLYCIYGRYNEKYYYGSPHSISSSYKGMVGAWTDWDLTELGKKQAYIGMY